MGEESDSAFCTCGGSTSSGRLLSARDTALRTSFAAASMSRDKRKVMLIEDEPSRLDELIVSMPSMPARASSRGWVTLVSTTDDDAPG